MSGATISSSAYLAASPAAPWVLQGVGDFNADGNADMLWRNTATGELDIWLMNGATIASSVVLPFSPSGDWSVQAVADFNQDGNADILWRNKVTGELDIWLMSGGTVTTSTVLPYEPSGSWSVVGVGDFYHTGNNDLLWRNTSTGELDIWLIAGATISSSATLAFSPDPAWEVQGVGDFNGDGYADILWRNAGGDVNVWLMNGSTVTSSNDLGGMPSGWAIQGTGDFNSDGQSDILWRNANGDVNIWFMSGGTISTSADLGVTPQPWQIASQPPYGVPPAASAVGYTTNTFSSTTLGNSAGQLYFPADFYYANFGTATQNADGSYTMTNGENLPMVATAHRDSTKPNKWSGECFAGGGYFDIYAQWTPYAGGGQSSWPQVGLADVVTTGNNAVGPWDQWGVQQITATAAPTTGATSVSIPAWTGLNNTTISNVAVAGAAGQFSATFSGLFPGETITITGTAAGSGAIQGYSSPTTYYVSAVNSTAQTFTLQTMGQTPIATTAGSLSGLTYTPGLSGTVTFSDAETQLVSFTPGATSISWTNGLTGSAFTSALSVSWGANFGNWPEVPIVEADYPTTTSLGLGSLINWYALLGYNIKVHTSFSPITGIDTSTPHHYSVLWVPATAGSQGYVNWYFDGTLVNTVTWNQFNPGDPPADGGQQTSSRLWTGGNAFGVLDSRCMIINMSTAPGTAAPMTIYGVNVWQASPANNQTQ